LAKKHQGIEDRVEPENELNNKFTQKNNENTNVCR